MMTAMLLVDRPAIVDAFARAGVSSSELAVICIDGTPRELVRSLARTRDHIAVLYVHDSATVIYPFAFEPIVTLVERGTSIVYRDLGLPPLGASAKRFGDPTLAIDAPILELRTIPIETLVRYCMRAARTLVTEHVGRHIETSR